MNWNVALIKDGIKRMVNGLSAGSRISCALRVFAVNPHIVRDDDDRRRLQDYLGREAVRCSWRVYAFVIMSNHLLIVVKPRATYWVRS